MKKKWMVYTGIVLVLVMVLTTVGLAVAGSSDDPLISLSYLTGSYKQELLQQAQTQIDEEVANAAWELEAQLDAVARAAGEQESAGTTGFWRTSIGAGESVVFQAGTEVLILSGTVVIDSGSLTDSTAGVVCGPGEMLTANHLYIGLNGGSLHVDTTVDLMICE